MGSACSCLKGGRVGAYDALEADEVHGGAAATRGVYNPNNTIEGVAPNSMAGIGVGTANNNTDDDDDDDDDLLVPGQSDDRLQLRAGAAAPSVQRLVAMQQPGSRSAATANTDIDVLHSLRRASQAALGAGPAGAAGGGAAAAAAAAATGGGDASALAVSWAGGGGSVCLHNDVDGSAVAAEAGRAAACEGYRCGAAWI